jgi:mediator of RNA polymerase II transcription subunit 12
LELLERFKNWPPAEDGALRLLLPLVLQYLEEFTQSELLARKLSYICVGRLAQLCSSQTTGGVSPNSPNHNMSVFLLLKYLFSNKMYTFGSKCFFFFSSPVSSQGTTTNSSTIAATFNEYVNCPHHKDIVLGLSAVIQVQF